MESLADEPQISSLLATLSQLAMQEPTRRKRLYILIQRKWTLYKMAILYAKRVSLRRLISEGLVSGILGQIIEGIRWKCRQYASVTLGLSSNDEVRTNLQDTSSFGLDDVLLLAINWTDDADLLSINELESAMESPSSTKIQVTMVSVSRSSVRSSS